MTEPVMKLTERCVITIKCDSPIIKVAPFDALVHVLEGEVEISIAGKLHSVQSGEMILMPENQPHALKAKKQFKMILTMIRS